ncbi:hypothetical protein [Sinorhizobium psoraleae]|uniref:Uncharacterized protein n=1 Tax=Sinorhizobium psoraleae TaxID=520838 RepID=A0ABT4KAB8_9HYPH|nr:hypothetical protein [Sinorhizobium psoraleae]MCZ4088911.1 hypothetical protein [Sinorhizobium psoraleae]
MTISKLIGRSFVALAIAVAPVAVAVVGTPNVAFAKGGNGGGNGGGGGGNGGGHGGGHSSSGKSGKSQTSTKGSSSRATSTQKSVVTRKKSGATVKAATAVRTEKLATAKLKSTVSGTAGLSSLNRNYHAYLNSSDPRMAAISAYAIAYAEFEAESGPDAIPTDPALSDEALREALESFTKGEVVTDETLAEAKDILGVGPAVGKIDQIRETLPEPELEPEPTDPETDTAN